jgi:uncharacterized protein (TIGR02145 family)
MKKILSIIIITFLLSSISVAQKMSIHTNNGTDAYNLADIDSITFDVSNDTTTGTLTDIDGNVYQTVKIGNQLWMAENLKVIHYRNGDAIPNVTENGSWSVLNTGAYCNYNNYENNVETYGRLYNWYTVNDPRGLAPEGWHVPTDEEWKQLEMFLGMSQSEADATNWRGTDEGGKMKEAGTAHWQSPNTGATNSSGFSALPGGSRSNNGGYLGITTAAKFFSSTSSGGGLAWGRILQHERSGIYRGGQKVEGFSIRCVRD